MSSINMRSAPFAVDGDKLPQMIRGKRKPPMTASTPRPVQQRALPTGHVSNFAFPKLISRKSVDSTYSGSSIKKPSIRLAASPTSTEEEGEGKFGPESVATTGNLDAFESKRRMVEYHQRIEVRNLRQHFERLIAQKDKRVFELSKEVEAAIKRGDDLPFLDPEDGADYNEESQKTIPKNSATTGYWPNGTTLSPGPGSCPVAECKGSDGEVRLVKLDLHLDSSSEDEGQPEGSSCPSELRTFADLFDPLCEHIEAHCAKIHARKKPRGRFHPRNLLRALFVGTSLSLAISHIMSEYDVEIAGLEQLLDEYQTLSEQKGRELRVLEAENELQTSRLASLRSQYEVEIQSLEATVKRTEADSCARAAMTAEEARHVEREARQQQEMAEDLAEAAALLAKELAIKAALAEAKAAKVKEAVRMEEASEAEMLLKQKTDFIDEIDNADNSYGLMGDAVAVLVASWAFIYHQNRN